MRPVTSQREHLYLGNVHTWMHACYISHNWKDYYKTAWDVNGVSEKIKQICDERIHVYFSSSRTIGSFLNRVRPHTDPNDITGVIYRIPCQDCDHSYVGETGRTLKTRLSEHRRNCRNGEVESVAQHTIEEDHRIDWEGCTVINRENWFSQYCW